MSFLLNHKVFAHTKPTGLLHVNNMGAQHLLRAAVMSEKQIIHVPFIIYLLRTVSYFRKDPMKLTQIHIPRQDKMTYVRGEREKRDKATLHVG